MSGIKTYFGQLDIILSNYGWRTLLLMLQYLGTIILYRNARLIRYPFYIRGRKHIQWDVGFTTGVGVRLDAFPARPEGKIVLKFGKYIQINDYVHIGAVNSIQIGDNVLIASRVFITDHNHGLFDKYDVLSSPLIAPSDRPLESKQVIIGDRVWIGEGVIILPGVSVGEGSIIGAGSVVTKDIPPNVLCVGVPAKIIKKYDFEKCQWIIA